jgi:hypothetical protein
MNKRIRLFSLLSGILLFALVGELLFFSATKAHTEAALGQKAALVRMVQLPDLSVATEARFIRFRSLADVYSPFNEGPELLDYFPATFTYAPADTEKLVPSRITIQ